MQVSVFRWLFWSDGLTNLEPLIRRLILFIQTPFLHTAERKNYPNHFPNHKSIILVSNSLFPFWFRYLSTFSPKISFIFLSCSNEPPQVSLFSGKSSDAGLLNGTFSMYWGLRIGYLLILTCGFLAVLLSLCINEDILWDYEVFWVNKYFIL